MMVLLIAIESRWKIIALVTIIVLVLSRVISRCFSRVLWAAIGELFAFFHLWWKTMASMISSHATVVEEEIVIIPIIVGCRISKAISIWADCRMIWEAGPRCDRICRCIWSIITQVGYVVRILLKLQINIDEIIQLKDIEKNL